MTVTVGLRFTDGTTTVTISNGSTGWVLEYAPKNERADVEQVTEKSRAMLLGGLSTVRGNIESINKLFQQAKVYQLERTGAVVYIERQLDTGDAWWRSELVEAVPLPGPEALDGDHINGKYQVDFIFTRKNYWEGAEAQIPLTNGNGTNVTTALTIHNHDDSTSGHDNWVSIAAADVAGDLPGPARIEMTNSYNDGAEVFGIYQLRIGQNWTDPANFTHILEAEAATGGTSYADANCSGGNYRAVSLASGGEVDLLTWTMASAAQAAGGGRWYKPLIRFRTDSAGGGNITTAPSLVSLRLKIKDATTNVTLYSGSLSYNTGELPVIRNPPALFGQTGLANISLILSGYQTTGSTVTLNIDFMELQPLDGWRMLIMPSNYVTYTYRLVDDGILGITYGDSGAGSGKVPHVGEYGDRIALKPGKLQRLYFLWEISSITAHVGYFTATLKIYYRPRRLTLN